MAHVYTVEFLFDAHASSLATDCVRKHILADDRYEAIQLARQLLVLQDPFIDVDRIEHCKVLRRDV